MVNAPEDGGPLSVSAGLRDRGILEERFTTKGTQDMCVH